MNIVVATLKAMRPKQWTKQGLLVVAPVFAGMYTDVDAMLKVALGIAFFSMVASSGYVLNDLRDIEADRKHPKKQHRPIASGALPVPAAWVLFVALLVGGMAGSFWLGTRFGVVTAAYLATTLSYSMLFKHTAILDVMLIASGFLLRAVAGAEAIEVKSSPWFLVCIAFGALFIALSKRLAEIRLLEGDAGAHRKVLQEYSEEMLLQFITIAVACSVISYALYTIEGSESRMMMATIPLLFYGIFRYLYLVDRGEAGGEPEITLLKDRPLQVSMVLFGIVTVLALRFGEVAT